MNEDMHKDCNHDCNHKTPYLSTTSLHSNLRFTPKAPRSVDHEIVRKLAPTLGRRSRTIKHEVVGREGGLGMAGWKETRLVMRVSWLPG
jgi:hypothetical protein